MSYIPVPDDGRRELAESVSEVGLREKDREKVRNIDQLNRRLKAV